MKYSFSELSQCCYRLREKMPYLPVLATSFLHCTNARDPVQEKILAGETSMVWPRILAHSLWLILRGGSFSLALFQLRWRWRKEIGELKQRHFDCLAKTWVVKSGKNREDDFYYGNLQEQLDCAGVRMLLLCGNLGNPWSAFVSEQISNSQKARLPDILLISFWNVWQMIFQQLKVSFLLWFRSFNEQDPLIKEMMKRSACGVLRFMALLNGLHYWIGKKGAQIWKPKTFLSFYEGVAWEKCLWMGIKEGDSRCTVAGYQHTVIMERCLEMRQPSRSLHEKTAPDVVLTSGYRSLQSMQDGHAVLKTKFIPFGTFRFSQSLFLKEPVPDHRTLLVVPEGLLSESIFLFNTALKIARELPQHRFIFRCHPILPFEKVRPHLEENLEQFQNVEISKGGAMETDFARSSALLYRGSSTLFYGILMGLKPFYLHKNGLEIIDPIFELKAWRDHVQSEKELVEKLCDYERTSSIQRMAQWRLATDYVKEYTIPVTEKSMERLLAIL